jgi:hypothetical protein
MYTDNFFTPVDFKETLRALKSMGLVAVGTVRANRLKGYKPKSGNKLKKEGRGSFNYATEKDNNIIAMK